MALNTVTTGNTVLASDINQLVNVLQRSSGQTETGKYYVNWGAYASGAQTSIYMQSLSRNATPVSVSIDTADQAPANQANSPSTFNLTANGFRIFDNSTGISTNCIAGGNFTIQY